MSYRAFWQRRCRAAAAGAGLKPQGGNCAVLPKNLFPSRYPTRGLFQLRFSLVLSPGPRSGFLHLHRYSYYVASHVLFLHPRKQINHCFLYSLLDFFSFSKTAWQHEAGRYQTAYPGKITGAFASKGYDAVSVGKLQRPLASRHPRSTTTLPTNRPFLMPLWRALLPITKKTRVKFPSMCRMSNRTLHCSPIFQRDALVEKVRQIFFYSPARSYRQPISPDDDARAVSFPRAG